MSWHSGPAGLQQSESVLQHRLLRLSGAQLDVIPYQRETHSAAPGQPELLPQRLGDRHLPLAGDRADDIRHTASLRLVDEALRMEP